MGPRAYLSWVAMLALTSVSHADGPRALMGPPVPDPFLDRAMPIPQEETSFVYLEQIKAVETVAGKPFVFPPDFIAFLTKSNLKMNCRLHSPPTPTDNTITMRGYFHELEEELGIICTYDAVRDTVVVDFPWHQSASPLTGAEMVQAVLHAPVVKKPGMLDFASLRAWNAPLDALFSRPENYPQAWKVRLMDRCNNSFCFNAFFPERFGIKKVREASGAEHLLLLDYCPSMVSEGPPAEIAFYLFDAQGKWEDGGIFEARNVWNNFTIAATSDQRRVSVPTVTTQIDRYSCTLALDGGDLFSQSDVFVFGWPSISGNWADKSISLALTSQTDTHFDYCLAVEKGKVEASLLKNGRPDAVAHCPEAGFSDLKRAP